MASPGRWPDGWVGRWQDTNAKTVTISRMHGSVTVTVAPGVAETPYRSAELLGGGTKEIENLPAVCYLDEERRKYLEIEAGTPDLGPTYRLYAATEDDDRSLKPFDSGNVDDLVLVPHTSIRLYDDYDDDLGVPWAYPLERLRYLQD